MQLAPTSRNAFQNRLLALNSIVPGEATRVGSRSSLACAQAPLQALGCGFVPVCHSRINICRSAMMLQDTAQLSALSNLAVSSSLCSRSCDDSKSDKRLALSWFVHAFVTCQGGMQVCAAHVEWGRSFQEEVDKATPSASRDDHSKRDRQPDRPLIVGYVSADLFTHSVSYFAEAPLAHHCPERHACCASTRFCSSTRRIMQLRHVVASVLSSPGIIVLPRAGKPLRVIWMMARLCAR